jgi:hypothetical protein
VQAWLDTQFVEELNNHSVGIPIEFIPMIKKGIMEVSTFRECLRRQTEFVDSVEIMHQGMSNSLAQIVKKFKVNAKHSLVALNQPSTPENWVATSF